MGVDLSGVFLTQDELVRLTGCVTRKGQEQWLLQYRIPFEDRPSGYTVLRARLPLLEAHPPLRLTHHTSGDTVPRRGSGLYFLLDGDELQYVGVTTNFFVRMAAHDKSGLPFDRVRFLPMPCGQAMVLEGEYIARLRPPFNTAGNPTKCSAKKISRGESGKKCVEIAERDSDIAR